jgi:ATP-binding cassette subfamily B protein RaxB
MTAHWPWSRTMRPILQAEAAECGLACLAMVANHHGHKTNLVGLRQRYPISLQGATLAQLVGIAADLGLAPRAVRLELDELDKLALPAILHWDMKHFVVLERVSGGRATIADPAAGRRTMSQEALGRHFTGVALELSPTLDFQPSEIRARTRLRDLWSHLSNYGGAVFQILVLSLLLQTTVLVTPLFLQLTIDEAIAQGDTSLLLLLFLGFAFVLTITGITSALRSWVVLVVGESLSYQLAGNLVRHMLRLPLGFFERRHVGDLMSRLGSVQPIQSLLTQGLVDVVIDSILALTTVAVMALISPLLMAVVIGTTLLYLAVSLLLYPALRQRTEEEILARADQETYLLESIRAVRSIKLYNHEAMRENGWRNLYADVISASYRTRIFGIQLELSERLLFGLQFLVVVYFGALAVLAQDMTIGLLLAFLTYRTNFTSSAIGLVGQLQSWRLLGLHLERLSDIVTEKRETLPHTPRTAVQPPPSVRAEGLGFSYGASQAPIFDKLDFEIPAGGFVAIVGPSGAGKTTLMRILLGLLPPTSGQLLIENVPLGPATTAAWRGRIGAVMQDDNLLTGTLADNIAFFDPQSDPSRIEQASRLARIHADIVKMPMAYQTLVGDMGSSLSAGQRQRILLARALYRDPDALFLDEGTANLDEENEEAIATMIASLPITRLVIAHRPALIARASLVYRLDAGRLICIDDRRSARAA